MSPTALSRRSLLTNSLLVSGGVLGLASLASATTTRGDAIKVVDTFSELGSISAALGDLVYLKGHTLPGIGGGDFIAKAGSVSNDNGSQINCPNNTMHWERFNSDVITPQMFGALANGKDNDTIAIQNAIKAVGRKAYSELFFPATPNHYNVTSPLIIEKPIKITGAGQNAVTIMAIDFRSNEYVFDFNFVDSPNNEYYEMSGFTVRTNNRLPTAIRICNAAYFLLKDLRLYDAYDGVFITGTRSYSIYFERFSAYQTAHNSVIFNTSKGGGQYSFVNSTFSGATGVYVDPACSLNNLSFVNCNFEKCTTNGFYVGGSVFGLSFVGCRTEGNSGDDFQINPAIGRVVAGLSITGCFFSPGGIGYTPIVLGGDGGKVRGFNICGNYVAIDSQPLIGFVRLNGDGESGSISGNYFNSVNMRPTDLMNQNTNRPGVHIFGNENLNDGKSPEL